MNKQPIIIHISKMLEDFEEEPLRAVYMVVRQMDALRKPQEKNITKYQNIQ